MSNEVLYTADFETGLERDLTACGYNKVFLWALCPIENHELLDKAKYSPEPEKPQYIREYIKKRVIYGDSNISEFFDTVFNLATKKQKTVIEFHNLSYDGEFIVYYLLSHGWIHTDDKILKHKRFRTVITELKVWYSIELCFNKCVIEIKDSYKLLAQSEKKLISGFKINKIYGVSKTEVDFMKMPPLFENGEWRKALPIEIERVTNDVLGMAIALRDFKGDKKSPTYMPKDTAAGCAFSSLKVSSFPDNPANKENKQKSRFEMRFKMHYPILVDPYDFSIDDMKKRKDRFDRVLRIGYIGGYCYVNPIHANKTLNNVVGYDQNSKYPTHMYYDLFPYGKAYTEEEARGLALNEQDLKENWVYIAEYTQIKAKIKKGWNPWIQRRGFEYHGVEMIKEIDEEIIILAQPLDELFLDSYEITSETNLRKFYFCAERGRFSEHVRYWYEIKSNTENNPVLKFYSKIQLNSSYGKFAQKNDRSHKIPVWSEETKEVSYAEIKPNNEESRQQFYLPVAMFITAYARADLIRKAHSFGDEFVYCDTDSLHLTGTYTNEELLKHGIKVHDNELGAWKLDKKYSSARYLHAKCYAGINAKEGDEDYGKLDIHIAGYNCATEEDYNKITLEDIYIGNTLPNKRTRKVCKGGCVLTTAPFEIKTISKDVVDG